MFGSVDDLWQSIGEAGAAIVVAVGAYWLAKVRDVVKQKLAKNFRASINRNLRVKELLQEVRASYDCDRVKLYQFHNGDYYSSGESIQKMSLTHCVVRRGIEPPVGMTYHQNIQVSNLTSLIARVLESNVIYSVVDELEDELYLKPLLMQGGVESAAFASVTGKKGALYGMLVLSWTHKLTEEFGELARLERYADQIGAELSFNVAGV